MGLRKIAGCFVPVALLALNAFAQTNRNTNPPTPGTLAYLAEFYTKQEFRVPMRDGAKLFTAVYSPKDLSSTYPILLTRTPYSLKPYSEDRYPSPNGALLHYAAEKFIFVLQDVRGRY